MFRVRLRLTVATLAAAALLSSTQLGHAAGYAYITNNVGNSMRIIDTATNTVVATPNLGGTGSFGAGVLPNGNFAYVQGANLVHVFNTVTNTVVTTINTGVDPRGIAPLPNSTRVYVANSGPDTVSVIDTSTNTVTATIAVGTNPAGIVASPDGARVYVANNGAGTISVISTATNTVTSSPTAPASPVGLTISPDGTTLYIVSAGGGVYPMNTGTLVTGTMIATGGNPRGVAVSPDGTRLYVTSLSTSAVNVINTADGTNIISVTVGASPYGVALNAAGTRAYTTNNGGSSVSVIDTTTTPISLVTTITGTQGAISIGNFVSPELSLLTVTPGSGGAVTAGATTGPQLSCSTGTTCTRNYASTINITLTATPDSGKQLSGWDGGGGCTGSDTTITIAMSAARTCTATFAAIPVGPPVPPAPSVAPPPPVWYNPGTTSSTVPAPATVGGAFVTESLAPQFQNPSSLTFTATAIDGGPLPTTLTFNTSTLRFSGTLPLPTRPIQPLAATAADATPRATAVPPNTVYPPSFAVTQVPVLVTARDSGGATMALTYIISVETPREQVTMTALSVTPQGIGGNAASIRPALSYDGGEIAFQTTASNLVSGDGAYVVRYHAQSGALDRLSDTAIPGGGPGAGARGPSTAATVGADGTYAAFASEGPGLVLGIPANNIRQIYRIGLKYPRVNLAVATPVAELVSGTAAGVAGDGSSDSPAISRDGRHVAFASSAGNLVAGVSGQQVYLKDLVTGAVSVVSAAAGGQVGNGASSEPSMAWDGRRIAFTSTATNLMAGITGQQIYLKDLDTGTVTLVSGRAGTVPGDGASSSPRLAGNGRGIVFVTTSSNLGGPGGVVQVVTGLELGLIARGAGDQPTISGDARYVAWRDASGQIQIIDGMRGVQTQVTRTAASTSGNGTSNWPALSGDGLSLAFATNATDLVGGNLAAGQVILAGNPLVDPGAPRYWHVTTGDLQGWAIERSGNRAYVASLTYDVGGNATWYAGFCQLNGLACAGQLAYTTGGTVLADARATQQTPGAAFTITFAENGIDAALTLPGTPLALRAFPLGGTTVPALPGLPQPGWWYNVDDPAGSTGWFLATSTPSINGRLGTPVAMLTGLVYDSAGRPFWAVAESAAITGSASFSLNSTLNRYSGGSPLGSNAAARPSATALGPIAVTWSSPRTAVAILPNGARVNLARWPF